MQIWQNLAPGFLPYVAVACGMQASSRLAPATARLAEPMPAFFFDRDQRSAGSGAADLAGENEGEVEAAEEETRCERGALLAHLRRPRRRALDGGWLATVRFDHAMVPASAAGAYMAEAALPLITGIDAFLDWERREPERYEYVGGVVRLMSGGSANHDLVSMNIAGELRERLRGTDCRVHGSKLKVRSPSGDSMYPDCFVRCGPHDGQAQVVDDPVIVVEVLSPATEQHDLTRKRWAYQSIPGLHTLLLVDPDTPRIEQSTRQNDGSWRSVTHDSHEAVLSLQGVDGELKLAMIYQDVDFARSQGGARPAG